MELNLFQMVNLETTYEKYLLLLELIAGSFENDYF